MRSVLLAGIFAFASTAAGAAPLYYNEAIHGDIAGSPTFAFDFGFNTVQGNLYGGLVSPTGQADFDFFNATFPADAFLFDIQVRLTDLPGGDGSFSNIFHYTASLGGVAYESAGIPLGGNVLGGVVWIWDGIRIDPDRSGRIIRVQEVDQMLSIGMNGRSPTTANHWHFGINVLRREQIEQLPIPLPAGLPLLGSGLLLLLGLRWGQSNGAGVRVGAYVVGPRDRLA